MEAAELRLKNVSKYYISGRVVTVGLSGADLVFRQGEFAAVTGESGSGKSTLANILAGILPFESGELLIDGESTARYNDTDWQNYRCERISYVAQNYGILPGNTVWDNVMSALYLAGMEKSEALKHAQKLLTEVDLWKYKRRKAARLSSGQKQRLAIARALAKPAKIIIADEPTANLDAKNSEKVLKLLADAAKDRLVVMITHDFRMAKKYATRQVVLHDSKVLSDTVLREKADVQESEAIKERKDLNAPAKKLGGYVASLQLKARPAWCVTMALFFTLTAFAIFAFLGTFIANLDDTSTRIYDNEAFRNGANTRIVAAKDKEGFLQENYDELLALPWVEAIERYDTAFDINYYYIENEDYSYRYSMNLGDMMSAASYSDAVIFRNHNKFVRTAPLLKSNTFLKAGELPEHINEVVAVGGEELIGTKLPVFFLDRKNWGEDSYVYIEMTVVGVTDYGSGLYFSDRAGKMFYQSLQGVVYGVDESLADDEVTLTETMIKRLSERIGKTPETTSLVNMNTSEVVDLKIAGTNLSKLANYYEISESSFDLMTYSESSVQASVIITDYSFTDRAIAAIQKLGYEAVSPYRISSVRKDAEKADARLNTLVLCLLALAMIILAQLVVQSAMFRLEMKNYEQLASIGLSCKTGKSSVVVQVLVFTAVGQVLCGVAVALCVYFGYQQIYDVYKYLTAPYIILMSLLHLIVSLLVSAAVCRMLQRSVFPFVRYEADVDLSELETDDVRSRCVETREQ